MRPSGAWWRFRYDVLLAAASRHRALGALYAVLAAGVELRRDPARRSVAVTRAARALGITRAQALRVFRASLVSEAREEADSAFFMRHTDLLASCIRATDEPPHAGGVIYATLHLGSPILAYLHLSRIRGLAVSIIGRGLDDTNPMPAAKRRFGQRKVAWVERVTGRPFLGVDAAAIARAREELVEGRGLYAAVDVPGDVAARMLTVDILGERVCLAAGVLTLASLTGASIRPVVGVREGHVVTVHYGPAIEGCRGVLPAVAVADAIGDLVRRFPHEWWLWPYLVPAP